MSRPTPRLCAGEILETVPLIMQFIRTEMRRRGSAEISIPHFRVLNFINRHPGESLSAIAERVGLSLPAMSRLVDGLVEHGFLSREPSAEDRRFVAIHITDAGRDLVRAARADAQNRLADVLAELRVEDRALVVEAMHKLRSLFAPGETVRVVQSG
jgi:DNA-binding MarR family transcriptional regulator